MNKLKEQINELLDIYKTVLKKTDAEILGFVGRVDSVDKIRTLGALTSYKHNVQGRIDTCILIKENIDNRTRDMVINSVEICNN